MTGDFTGDGAPWGTVADGAGRRRRVVAAVADLLCRHGLRGANLGAAGTLAGVSASWLREHFTDFEALVAEVVRVQVLAVFANAGHRLATAVSPGDLYRWHDEVVDGYRGTRVSAGYPLGIAVYELAGHDGRASEALAASLDAWQSALGDAFARLRDHGELAPGLSPAELATAVMGALVGAMSRTGKAGRSDDVLEPFGMMLRHVLNLTARAAEE